MLSDLEIAQKAPLKPILEIGADLGIPQNSSFPTDITRPRWTCAFSRPCGIAPTGA